MKAAETKPAAKPATKAPPFFSKEKGQEFFGGNATEAAFFGKSHTVSAIQPKLTIGKPNDKYEQEADAMADKVVQRLSEPEAVQTKPITSAITPLVQLKCAECEQEEKLQKKEKEEEETKLSDKKLQRNGLTENLPEFSKTENPIQLKLQPTDKQEVNPDALAVKAVKPLTKSEPVQPKPLAPADTRLLQPKCATCLQETKTPEKEEDEEKLPGKKLQRKPDFADNPEQPDEEEDELVQRKCAECEMKEKLQTKANASSISGSANLESSLSASKGSGSPLPESTRQQMEASFGADFSQVRIHSDGAAVHMNRDLSAQAFTHGNDIYFNSGKYDTRSKEGRHLLAHELTHTVQQNGMSQVQRLIQLRPIDPHHVMDEIFNEGLGRDILKVPIQYRTAYNDTVWFTTFTDFLKQCGIDPDSIEERPLVYMALLYGMLPKQPTGWQNGIFQMKSEDNVGGLLNLEFKLPKTAAAEIGVSVFFTSPKDKVEIEASAKVRSGAFHPLTALSFVIPNTDMASVQQTFRYKIDSGAYKGNSATFHLTYVLFTPRSPFKQQTIYFNERIGFDLVSKEKLEVDFNGKFDIPLDSFLDPKKPEQIEKLMPELIKNGLNLDASLGGTHSKGTDIETLVMGFAKEKHKIVSLQQLEDPATDPITRAQVFTYRMLALLETFRVGDAFVSKEEPPVHLSFDLLKDALAKATMQDSPGYMIIQEGKKYTVYYLTSTDLAWLAKKERGEKPDTPKRYVGINLDNMLALEFYGAHAFNNLPHKRSMLASSYFQSQKELEDKSSSIANYLLCFRTPDGYFSAYNLTQEDAAKVWKSFDQANAVTRHKVEGTSLDVTGIIVRSDEKSISYILKINDEHYEGRTRFASMYFALNNATDYAKIGEELKHLNDPQVVIYIQNELLRPNAMNPDQLFKESLKQMQGIGGTALVDAIGARAFGLVAGEAERKGIEMMESMFNFLDALVQDDLLMKAILMSFRGREAAEKTEIAGIFTSNEDEGARLIRIMDDDASMNEFLMGNTVDNLNLTIALENLTKSRDKLKDSLDERRALLTKPTFRYELAFLVQPGEVGNTIREYVYDALGFSLDPKAFPHEDQNSSWFPSPLEENGKARTNLLEQLYINGAINIYHKYKLLKTVQTVAMVASVFSLARGAGLWAVARAGLTAGTARAILLEALVTSVVAGVMLEGIQVAMGKKFSWKDLGWSIGEAFVMMLTFSWVNSLFRLPLTKFTVNAFLFVGYGVGRFYYEHKRMPNGFEFGMIVLESVLLMTLLHIGTKLTDPFFRKLIAKYGVHPELRAINENLQKVVKEIAIESAKKGGADKAKVQQLGDQYMEYVKQYREWVLKNQDKFTKEEVDAEMAKLDMLLENWVEAKFVDVTGLTKVAQTQTVFYYKPGADSAKALTERYGEGNVIIDPKTGLGTIKTPEGTFKLIPQETAGSADLTVDGKTLAEFFGSSIRKIDMGVYAFGKGALAGIKEKVTKRPDGKWEDLGDNTYAATIGGKRIIFVEEGATVTLDQAIAMETKASGAGMDYLDKSLSAEAKEGLKILRDGPLKNMSNLDVLQYLKNIRDAINNGKEPLGPGGEPIESKPKSFNEYLEKITEAYKADPDGTLGKRTEAPELEPVVKDAPRGQRPTIDGKRRLRINEKGECEVCASPCQKLRDKYAAVMTPKLDGEIAKIEKNKKLTDAQKEAKLLPIEQKLAELLNKTAKDITAEVEAGRIKPDAGKWKFANNWEKWVTKKKGRIIEYADGSFDLIAKDGTTVRYSPEGFPDFSPFLTHPSGIKTAYLEEFHTDRTIDYRLANEKVGKKSTWGDKPPRGWRWHHHQDGHTMQLVPRWIHTLFSHPVCRLILPDPDHSHHPGH